jgi:hypothetical protein
MHLSTRSTPSGRVRRERFGLGGVELRHALAVSVLVDATPIEVEAVDVICTAELAARFRAHT